MNRERLLFVAVVAIVALWFFVLRDQPQYRQTAKPGTAKLAILEVPPPDYPQRTLRMPETHGLFTLVTNETPYPRPDLAAMLDAPKAYELPTIWPPTTYAVSVDRYGRFLRRSMASPADGAATITLPEAGGDGGGGVADGADAVARLDAWQSYSSDSVGRVEEIVVNGTTYREPSQLPAAGTDEALESRFYYYLCLLEDEGRAQAEGVTEVVARLWLGGKPAGTVRQRFPGVIHSFRIGTEGTQQGWLAGRKAFLRARGGFKEHFDEGKRLLEAGVENEDKARIAWALRMLQVARERIPAEAQASLSRVLLLMLDAASRLNRQELVLELAFEHLAKFPGEEEVLEYVGGILGSRTFGLHALAERFFALAPNSTFAQRRRAAVLIRLGDLNEARGLLESGRAGTGPETDLLLARVALALGDLDTAESRARRHTSAAEPADQSQAHQILGAAAYVRGDAAAAEDRFTSAVQADPRNSFAVSDLGLALAVQGRAADARVCFARAFELDPIDNPVTPRVGEACLLLAGDDAAGARDLLTRIRNDNPQDLLVRFLLGYAHERTGDLAQAAELYRSTLDDDHRYRVAIARLGVVQARRAEADGDAELTKEAEAHLLKAVALNPEDALLPYTLGRFLLRQHAKPRLAKEMLAKAQRAPEADGADPHLTFWAELGQAFIDYRNEQVEERLVKAQLNTLRDRIKDTMPPGTTEDAAVKGHEVYAAATEALAIVQETENKVNKTWTFPSKPRDWDFNAKDPMKVNVRNGKLTFWGRVDYGGRARQDDFALPLEHCSASYPDPDLTGDTFHELHVKGTIPAGARVDFGVGLVNETRGRRGPAGIQIRRKSRTGTAEVRLDGGEHEIWRTLRARDYAEMDKVPWPEGEFRISIVVERGEQSGREGRFRLLLNDINVFEAQLGTTAERCSVFGSARKGTKAVIYLWAEGSEGLEIPGITVDEVVLTRKKER